MVRQSIANKIRIYMIHKIVKEKPSEAKTATRIKDAK